MEENRKQIRLDIPLDITYRPLDKRFFDADTTSKDISTGGIRMVANQELDPSSDIGLQVHMPDNDEPIVAEAAIVWRRQILNQKNNYKERYEFGLKFVEISGFDRSRIAKFINTRLYIQRHSENIPSKNIVSLKLKEKSEVISLIKENINAVEKGLRIIDEQIDTNNNTIIDLLGIDVSGQLVILHIKTSDKQLFIEEILKNYDWAHENIALLHRIYGKDVDIKQDPRIIIIGDLFSESFRRYVSYINVNSIKFSTYQGLEINGDKALLIGPIDDNTSHQISIKKKSAENHVAIQEEETQIDPEEISDANEEHKKIIRWLWKKR